MRSRCAGIAFAVATLFFGLRGQAQNPNNPLDAALLHWYGGDISALFTANLGLQPEAIAFDGANMWIANLASNTVTKLRASDGACVGTCVFDVGTGPGLVAFDGANIWVANDSGTVTKLRATDGACVGTCTFSSGGPPGSVPLGIAFDGTSLWVANSIGLAGPGAVTKLSTSGTVLASYTVGENPFFVAYDGANIWVTNADDGTVTKLRASDGACLPAGACTFSVGGPSAAALGVAFDGVYIWVANPTPSTVTKLRASTGAIVGVFQLGPATNTPVGVAFDGANIWVTYGQGSHLPASGVYKL